MENFVERNTIQRISVPVERCSTSTELKWNISRISCFQLVANVTKYPEDAWKQKAEGRVILQFVVDEEGKMTYPKILQSVRYDIDKEAIRAFKAIADVYRWSPGYQDGEAKRVKFTMPLYFRIPK